MNDKLQPVDNEEKNRLKLARKFPLRPIASEAQYDVAIGIIHQLAMRGEHGLDRGEGRYLDALSSLVESYENRHHPIGPDRLRPHQRLKRLAEESGLSHADVARLLGVSQPFVCSLLLGKRELSLAHLKRLAEYFHISSRYFTK